MMPKHMTPGSPEAIAAGCLCPVLDNRHGVGWFVRGQVQYWYAEDCPLHGALAETQENDDDAMS